MSNKGRRKQTLCWKCANATNSGCSWSRSLTPVEGWTAEEDEFVTNYLDKRTFLVIDCPEFIRDNVVKCEDCKFFEVKGKTTMYGYCRKRELPTDVYRNCGHAKRRSRK